MPSPSFWPTTRDELEELQRALAERSRGEPGWHPPADRPTRVGAVFVAPRRGGVGLGAAGDPAWVAAVVMVEGRAVDSFVVEGTFDAPYAPGLLALREGRLLDEAVRRLSEPSDVLLVNASGRDHPRGAGLALHLGAARRLPSVGVTDRPLLGVGGEPGPERGAAAELWLGSELVAYRLRTLAGARPVAVHAGWRVDAPTARAVVLGMATGSRTPEPLREARRLARTARSAPAGWLDASP